MGDHRQLSLNTITEIDSYEAYRILLEDNDSVKRFIPNVRTQNDNYYQMNRGSFNRNKRGRSNVIQNIITAVDEFDRKPEKKDLTETARLIATRLIHSRETYVCLGALLKQYLPKNDDGKAIRAISLLRDVAMFTTRYAMSNSTQPEIIFGIFWWIKNDLSPYVEDCGGWPVVLDKSWAFMKEHKVLLTVSAVALGGLAVLGLLLNPNRRKN